MPNYQDIPERDQDKVDFQELLADFLYNGSIGNLFKLADLLPYSIYEPGPSAKGILYSHMVCCGNVPTTSFHAPYDEP